MVLIDTLEHYYGDRDNQGNLRTQGEPQPTDEPFDMLEEEPLDLDEFDEDEDEDELDDVIEDNDPSYAQKEKEQEED